jgi:sec-independent protein translocase protein TatA
VEVLLIAGIGTPEIILILVIVLLLFGVGRISKLFGEVGSGMRNFRDSMKGDDDTEPKDK